MDEYLASAPAEIREVLTANMRKNEREKGKLIEKLTAHLTANKKKSRQESLERRSLEDLRDLAEDMEELLVTNSKKNGRGPEDDDDEDDPDEALVANYNGRQGTNLNEEDDGDEAGYTRGLPLFNAKRLRKMATLEKGENRDLLDEINVDFEDTAENN